MSDILILLAVIIISSFLFIVYDAIMVARESRREVAHMLEQRRIMADKEEMRKLYTSSPPTNNEDK